MYYAFLGHARELSLLELQSLGYTSSGVTDNIVEIAEPSLLTQLDKLGGTFKVAEGLREVDSDSCLSGLVEEITKDTSKNIAITDYADLELSIPDLLSLKKQVALVRPIRLVSTDTAEHEIVMLRSQHVSEFNLIKVRGQITIAKTVWLSDGLDWSGRDRARPYQDIKRGMLPPKIARIMVNLAARGQSGTLLDPFCGTGTILMEAMLTGLSVLGSDNDQAAIDGTRANLEWLSHTYSLKPDSYQLITADATHISEHVQSVDFIATEPYLGPLLESRSLPDLDKVKNIARGLDKLYRGSLREWVKILAPRGVVCLVIPEFHLHQSGRTPQIIPTISVDTITALGYNIASQVSYSKPGAVVIRKITTLIKN